MTSSPHDAEVGAEVLAQPAARGSRAPGPARRAVRWWAGVACSCAVSIPVGWVLSFGALLPFLLGLFFFVLFGLFLGAIAYRVAAAGRPYRKAPLAAGTSLIVMTCWGASILKESRDFPVDVGEWAVDTAPDLRGMTPDEFRAEGTRQAKGFLQTRYAPGGIIGYLHWMAASGEVRRNEVPLLRHSFVRPQNKGWFFMRVLLSLGFLAFGVGSQTLPLRKAPDGRSTPTPKALES